MVELFEIGGGLAVNCNPGGSFHGWLFRKHPDGQWVSVRKLVTVPPISGAFLNVLRAAREHDGT